MTPIRKVGIIGTGQMGSGIAHVVALSGYDVLLSDLSKDEQAARGFLYINDQGSWPSDVDELLDRLPEDWIEETSRGRR